MIIVGRHINGITINPLEYLLDDAGNEMQFESEEKARDGAFMDSSDPDADENPGMIME